MEKLRLDGNAAAGLLREVFATEMTAATGTCDGCGTAGPVGELHLYKAAGMVLRCPHCEAVLMKIVSDGTRVWIDLRGVRTMELSG